jgi:hypothetical protein
MYELEIVDVIGFCSRYAIINHTYQKKQHELHRQHILNFVAFMRDNFKAKEGEKNDLEFHRLISNCHDWLKKTKNWKKKPKITLRLPETVAANRWTNVELDMFSGYITESISTTNKACVLPRKEFENPLGIVEWLLSVLSQKYTNIYLKQIMTLAQIKI